MLMGLDVGGTKVEVALLTPDFEVIRSVVTPTERFRRGSLAFLDDLLDLIATHFTDEVEAIGLSLCFPINNGHTTYSSLLGGGVDVPVERIISERFSVPVVTDDDLHAHASAEKLLGRGGNNFVILNLGTGVGLCQVLREVVRGRHNRAGLICLEPYWVAELETCLPVDQVVGGKGLAFLYSELTSSKGKHSGGKRDIDAREIFEVKSKDPAARQAYEIFVRALAKLVTQITYFFDPDEIVIVGSLKRALPIFYDDVMSEARRLFPVPLFTPPPIVASTLDSAATRGVFLRDASTLTGKGLMDRRF